ncbi:hypothetical protein WJX79_002079 [Trebouxia sp. C0005]
MLRQAGLLNCMSVKDCLIRVKGPAASARVSDRFPDLTPEQAVARTVNGELRAQGVQLAEAEVEDRSQQTNAEIAMAAFEKAPPHKNANFTAEAWATCIMHLECSDQDEAAKELNHIVNLCRSVLRKQELLDFELSVASSEKSELTEAVHQEINNLLRRALTTS